MIRGMRNIGVRLWLTALAAVPVWIYFMPWLSRFFPGISPAVLFFFMAVFSYLAIGMLLHLTGARMIGRLIREAEVWERTAIPSKAEKKYLQAVRIFDSFLISPLRSAKIQSMITGSLARFSLTSGRKKEAFGQAVLVHLAADPGDEAVAALWLEQFCGNSTATIQEQDLLTCLADAHCENPKIAPLLTRIFLDLGRMDFSARQLFARAGELPEQKKNYPQDIETLIGEPDQTLGRFAMPLAQEDLESFGTPVETPLRQPEGTGLAGTVSTGIGKLGRQVRGVSAGVWERTGFILGRFTAVIKKQKQWRFYMKTAIMAMLCLGLGIFMYHTISYLRVPAPATETQAVMEKSVFKPFTIQVAAYLKEAHADQYVRTLKLQGIDARIKLTAGGGKTWYLIQVSEFEDKAAAAAYGNDLKSRNMIEDFFVSNK
jgi:hypothetical protein